MTYTTNAPTEPGYYWFCFQHWSPSSHHPRSLIRRIVRDRDGKLYDALVGDDWEWGPDPRYLAMDYPGYWSERLKNPFAALEQVLETYPKGSL